MSYYEFAVLDPRPQGAVANDKIFSEASQGVLGIEVTVPALAARCTLGNIDPQHSEGKADLTAIEIAADDCLPPQGAVLATVRPDLDSVGAMAIFEMATTAEFSINNAVRSRIDAIARADKFARGDWPGRQPLPTTENPWPTEGAADSTRSLAAIAAAVADFKVPLDQRVEWMKEWLLAGEEPPKYREQAERERLDLVKALADGTINVSVAALGRIAVVESTHRSATSVGYSLAPVVVALNPSFRQGPGDPYKKFTICAFEAKFADIKSALAELATSEAGWGGSPTIGGSPQGVSSTLTVEQVTEVVTRRLLEPCPGTVLGDGSCDCCHICEQKPGDKCGKVWSAQGIADHQAEFEALSSREGVAQFWGTGNGFKDWTMTQARRIVAAGGPAKYLVSCSSSR